MPFDVSISLCGYLDVRRACAVPVSDDLQARSRWVALLRNPSPGLASVSAELTAVPQEQNRVILHPEARATIRSGRPHDEHRSNWCQPRRSAAALPAQCRQSTSNPESLFDHPVSSSSLSFCLSLPAPAAAISSTHEHAEADGNDRDRCRSSAGDGPPRRTEDVPTVHRRTAAARPFVETRHEAEEDGHTRCIRSTDLLP